MKILIAGDLHLTDHKPENRVDDYENTCLHKLQFILNYSIKNNVEMIVFPGDIFDQPSPSYSFFTKVVNIIKNINIQIFVVAGQHDLKFRNIQNTALSALQASIKNFSINFNENFSDIFIHSSSFGEAITAPLNNKYNVLIIHKMIIKEKLWEKQTDYVEGNSFLKNNKFDLIISGDNHKFFIENVEDRFLFNCGSMLRSNTTQLEHIPKIVVFDTQKLKYEIINIPIEEAEKVFAVDKILRDKEKNEKLDSFISGLSKQKTMELNFESNLNEYTKINLIDEDIKKIIKECMKEDMKWIT